MPAPTVQLSPAEWADAELCELSLGRFTRRSWPYVEPSAFIDNWHIDAVTEHLEWVADGEITRLLINEPPRHMKSLGANVFFPAWVWAQDPDPKKEGHGFAVRPGALKGPGVKFVALSYDQRWSTRDNVKCRRVIDSPWYQHNWGNRFSLQGDQNQKTRFDNLRGGFRFATSETGALTGEGGDIIIYDDPHNVRNVDHDNIRDATLQFWDESMPSRLNDQKRGVFIIIMQRVHEKDLSGHILARELGWVHICLPAVHERSHPFVFVKGLPHRRNSPPGSRYQWKKGEPWKDPREEGEPLWPQRFDLEALKKIAKDENMSSHVAAGQLQQRPTARQGGVFKREWFEIVEAIPASAQFHRVRAWDLAGTEESSGSDPDFTVGLRMCRDPISGIFYIDSVFRDRISPAGVESAIRNLASNDGYGTRIRLPQDPGQAGKFQVRQFVTKLAGYQVAIEAESTSKENRADAFAAQCEVGNVKLVRGPWNQAFIDELCAFNKGAHDDQVDAGTAAFRTLLQVPNVPLHGYQGH